MIIQRDLYIHDLHYILKFDHYCFRFYLKNIPQKYRYHMTKQQKQHFRFWEDQPIYEDIALHIPALLVFRKIMMLIEQIVHQYHLQYWTFSASSDRKANIYEKLLIRYIQQQKRSFVYLRDDIHFYVYPSKYEI